MSSPLPNLSKDLTTNGLAFLRRAVGDLTTESTTQPLSFAVADLAVAIEVLMKARLAREHWSLICAEPDKATPPKIMLGEFKTVTSDQAATRLETTLGISMKAHGWIDRVLEVGRLRNRVMHFALLGLEPVGLQAAAGRGLDFILWLLGTEFTGTGDSDTNDLVADAVGELADKIGKLKDLVAERLKTVDSELSGAVICVECPRCGQPTLMLRDGEPARWPFCLWDPPSGVEAAVEYADTMLGRSTYEAITSGGEFPAARCVNCAAEALVEGIVQTRPTTLPVADWGCFACGYTATQLELDRCSRCGEVTEADDDGLAVCSECWSQLIGED